MGASHALTPALLLPFALPFALACGPRELPPLGEVVVVVDTDLPVPRVASALRVDTYAKDGAWLESRDIARRDPRDWPASFSVQAADDTRERDVLIRVRVHGERMRDVIGGPRLVVDGRDITPSSEPEPALTVDRLLLVRLQPGERGRAQIVARASCAGSQAQTDPSALATCVEGDALEPLQLATLDPELSTPPASLAGSAARTPCPTASANVSAPATTSERTCIEGGAFVVGVDDVQVVPDPTLPATPERIARVGTFAIDRDEVTVARFRDAVARGLVPVDTPGTTEGELGTTPETTCSFSAAPRGREDFAMTCVTWRTARALCMFSGGDLATEAQWEYAATSAARPGKTTFPWGDDVPDCARAVYGRLALAGLPGACEKEAGSGPRAVTVSSLPIAPGDVSAAGVRGLGGGVAEWTRDSPAAYDAPCWRGIDATCSDPAGDAHVVRGGAWASSPINVRSTARLASRKATSFIGFRCVYGP
jgi:formylglycine-generating enzyme required for sulfatase activity